MAYAILSPSDIKKCLAQLKKDVKKLEKLADNPTDTYYSKREVFTKKLQKFLNLPFLPVVNKNELLLVIEWGNRYRPLALHSLLISILNAKQSEDSNADENNDGVNIFMYIFDNKI